METPTRTRILRADQQKIGREGECALGTADGDDFVLYGLAQDFQRFWGELIYFVEKKYPSVR